MMRRKIFLLSVFLLILILILHISALYFYLYWTHWWFDILLHLLGGFWVAITAYWLFFLSRLVRRPSLTKKNLFFIAVFSSLIVGFIWEAYELLAGFVSLDDPNYFLDTYKDLAMDVVGSIGAYYFFLYRVLPKIEQIDIQK